MFYRYLNLACLLLVVCLLRYKFTREIHFKPLRLILQGYTSKLLTDPESRLSFNKKIKLSEVDTYQLELIPKVSDDLADAILKKRIGVLAEAKTLPYKRSYQALEQVHGIGEKSAYRFSEYLELE